MMQCSTCHTDLDPDARFCPSCGTHQLSCPACQQPVPPESRFCMHCGTTLVNAQRQPTAFLPAERKRATVLFADLVGSTALIEGQDPEVVYSLYNRSLQVMSAAVLRWGGTIGQLMGDGMLAYFGVPSAHEDDAVWAALAALDIIAEISTITSPAGQRLHVRVGLNTGDVLMAPMGLEGQMIQSAVGETVNVAARLESNAPPDTVLVSKATWLELAHTFEGDSLGTVTLRGKRDPIPVWRVVRRRPTRGKPRGTNRLESPLVGRDHERAALEAQLDAIREGAEGSGGMTLVLGEAGIGKSRLIGELTNALRARGGTVLEGRCLSYTQAQPYAPWLDLLRTWCGADGEDRTENQSRLATALGDIFESRQLAMHGAVLANLLSLPISEQDQEHLAQLTPQVRNVRIWQALVAWAEALTRQQPVVLIFEDLHWSDPSSLAAMEQLLDLCRTQPLLILGATRYDRPVPLERLERQGAERLGEQMRMIHLEPLAVQDSRSLIGSLLNEEVSDDLLAMVVERADGNPLFVEELLRTLIEEGALQRDEGRWVLAAGAERVPTSIQALISARIDRLTVERKALLQQASVIGRVFWRRLLAVIRHDSDGLDSDLVALSEYRLVRQRGWRDLWEAEYIFHHALTQEAAYASIPLSERQRNHRAVAEAMEALLPDNPTEFLVPLATHWERAGDVTSACYRSTGKDSWIKRLRAKGVQRGIEANQG